MNFDFKITNDGVRADHSRIFITVDAKYQRIRFSNHCFDQLNLKPGSYFVLSYSSKEKAIGIPIETPEGENTFKIGKKAYIKIPQLFTNVPDFRKLKDNTRFFYSETKNGYYIFKQRSEKGAE